MRGFYNTISYFSTWITAFPSLWNRISSASTGVGITAVSYTHLDVYKRQVKGDVENGLLFCGAKAYMADKIETVHDVIADLFGTESECIRLS